MKQRQLIGIVGGLGPYAHLDFERKLLQAAKERLGARNDQDFPQWVLSCLPQTPDRTAAFLGRSESPVPHLQRSLDRLQRAGADFAVIACNTAHLFLDAIGGSLPILSMIEATAERAAELAPGGRVGLLATSGTLDSRLYHDALESHGLHPSSPLDLEGGERLQAEGVMAAIYGPLVAGEHQGGGIKSEGSSEHGRHLLEDAARRLVNEAHVDLLIAGCTEVPLALPVVEVAGRPLLDPARILADEAIRVAYDVTPDAPTADRRT